MARHVTARDEFIRTRWALYLGARVTPKGRISREALDKELQDALRRPSRGAGLLSRHLRGKNTVSSGNAFAIGEALRRLGEPHESGPVALYACGHDAHLIAFMAHLAGMGRDALRTALDLFAALPLAVEPEVDALRSGLDLSFELHAAGQRGQSLPVYEARAFIANAIAHMPQATLDEAWRMTYYRATPTRAITSVAVKEAFRIASSSLLPDRARDAAWLILDEWEAGLGEQWPSLDRPRWRHAYREWRSKVHTELERESEARATAMIIAQFTPGELAARERFLKQTTPRRVRACAPSQKRKGKRE
jgi:hypothetical protein